MAVNVTNPFSKVGEWLDKPYEERGTLGKYLDPGISQQDVKEGFMHYKDVLADAQQTDPQGLSEAQKEQATQSAATQAGKIIAAQQAALGDGAVAQPTAQSLKRAQLIAEEGAGAIAETTADTRAQAEALSEEIEAAEREYLDATEQRALQNILAYRAARQEYIDRVFDFGQDATKIGVSTVSGM